MADVTIAGLTTELTTPNANDWIGIWDLAAGQYKKIKQSNLVGITVTGGGTIALGGFTLTVPATGTAALIASGSWSPAITVGGDSAGTQTVTGMYYTIGNLVFCWARIDLATKGAATGNMSIESLPVAATGTKQYLFNIAWGDLDDDLDSAVGLSDQTYRSAVQVLGITAAGQLINTRLTDTSLKNGSILIISGMYEK
jgi:hypothetical protein